jgi:hypothetical protein
VEIIEDVALNQMEKNIVTCSPVDFYFFAKFKQKIMDSNF